MAPSRPQLAGKGGQLHVRKQFCTQRQLLLLCSHMGCCALLCCAVLLWTTISSSRGSAANGAVS
jgi:hypothetical protein